METLLEIALANALVAAALALIAAGVGAWLRRPGFAYALWLLVLLKLITPPLIRVPLTSEPLTSDVTRERRSAARPLAPVNVAFSRREPARPSPVGAGSRELEPEDVQRALPSASVQSETAAGGAGADEPATLPGSSLAGSSLAGALQAPAASSLPVGAARGADEASAATTPVAPSPPPTPSRLWTQLAEILALWPVVVFWIWIGGGVLVVARTFGGAVRFRRLLRLATPAPEALGHETQRLAVAVGLRRSPTVLVISGLVSPMVWALGRNARLVLPRDLVADLDAAELSTLITHELAHLRRRDHWVRLIELLVGVLYWWNPVVWWARRSMREVEEQACDAWVVTTLPDAASTYAAALLKTASFLSRTRPALPPAGSGIGHFYSLKRRLIMIMQGTTPRGVSTAGKLTVLALGAVLLPFAPTWAQRDDFSEERRTEDGAIVEGAAIVGETTSAAPEEQARTERSRSSDLDQLAAALVADEGRESDVRKDRDEALEKLLRDIGRLLVEGRHDAAQKLAREARELFPDHGRRRAREREWTAGQQFLGESQGTVHQRSESNHRERREQLFEDRGERSLRLDDLLTGDLRSEILKGLRKAQGEVHEAIEEAREDIEEAIEEAPPEVRQVLRELDFDEIVESALKSAPAAIQQVLREVDLQGTARETLRRFNEERVRLADHLQKELGGEVTAEIREALREAQEEIQKAMLEAREEIQEAVREAPAELRRILRELEVDKIVEKGLRKAPRFMQEVLREVDIGKTTREALRAVEPEQQLVAPEHGEDAGREGRGGRAAEMRGLQRRVSELERRLEGLLREMIGLRRALEARAAERP